VTNALPNRRVAGVRVRLGAAVFLILAGSACAPRSGGAPVLIGPSARGSGDAVLASARTYTGASYRSGGSSPAGFDCSGFVQFLYARSGVRLPRTAAAQFDVGQRIGPHAVSAGDLVFFRTAGRSVSHVGIATGDGAFIHAPNARSRVRLDRLDSGYWAERYAGARRVLRR
jgi:cell wall-associated NlpC family hydrolase